MPIHSDYQASEALKTKYISVTPFNGQNVPICQRIRKSPDFQRMSDQARARVNGTVG